MDLIDETLYKVEIHEVMLSSRFVSRTPCVWRKAFNSDAVSIAPA